MAGTLMEIWVKLVGGLTLYLPSQTRKETYSEPAIEPGRRTIFATCAPSWRLRHSNAICGLQRISAQDLNADGIGKQGYRVPIGVGGVQIRET